MTVRHIEVLLFLLAFPCLLVAQQPVAGAITGLVLDADTGHPVSKTHLTLVPRGTQEAQTMSARSDASGRFQFEALVPGQYAIMAMRTGYIRQDSLDQNLVTIRDGHVEGVVIQIRRGAVIAGRVVDEGGEPVAQITVMATEARYTGGGPQRTSYRSAITNDLGRYRLFGLMPGDYYVIVRQNSDRSETLTPDYGPAYYPVADDGSNAPPLRLRAGEQTLGRRYLPDSPAWRASERAYHRQPHWSARILGERLDCTQHGACFSSDRELPLCDFLGNGRVHHRGYRPRGLHRYSHQQDRR